MAIKEVREKFESLDYLRGNEAFSEYKKYWDDEVDPVVKNENLRKFVCKFPFESREQRRRLLAAMDAPLV